MKRYDIDFGTDEVEAEMVVSEYGEYVRFHDMQAVVQPLVDALEEVAGLKFFGGWNIDPPYVESAKKALAAYREAMGVEK